MNEEYFPSHPDYGEPEEQVLANFSDEDHKKRTFGGPKKSKPQRPAFLKVANKDPQGKSTLTIGKLYEVGGGEEPRLIESLECSLVYASDIRTLAPWKGGELNILCQSHNAEYPSARIKMPFCLKGDAQEIGETLKKYRFKDAQIKGIIPQVVDNFGRLNRCAYRTESGGLIPLCPKAVADESGNRPCVQKMKIILYAHNEDRFFTMELKGLDLSRSKTYISPFRQFQQWVQDKGIDYPYVHFTLSGAIGPKGFAVANFENLFVIEDASVRAKMDESYKKFEAEQLEAQDYIPPPETSDHPKDS